ncbi:MAG TPA: MMPL family transporter, partial [Nitrolancea sp.]|nr:MMPL family transporter [Nitrolancea sp.]
MIRPITDFAASRRGKWITVALWVILSAIITPLAPKLSDVTSNDQSTFLPSGAESTRVADLVKTDFPSSGTPVIIVFRNAGGLSERDLTQAKQVSDWLVSGAAGANVHDVVSIFTVPQAAEGLRSADQTTMTMIVNITGEPAGDEYTATVERIRDFTGQFDSGSLQVKVSGPGGLLADLLKVFERIDGFLLLVTAGLVLVLLILIYRSPVVALVPIVSVGWVFSLASAIGALLAEHAGLLVNGQATGIMTVLLFGAGTDYCLFISSRYREELLRVDDTHEAMQRAMRGVGEAIISAAGTILIATLALLLAVLRSNQALGPLLAIAIGVMLLAALTLVPAILAILGRRAFWPFVPHVDHDHEPAERRGIWSQVAGLVARRPGVVFGSTLVLFVVLALGTFTMRQDFDTLSGLPSGTESRAGFELLRQGFPPGDLAPTEAYVVFPSGESVLDAKNLRKVDAITLALAGRPGISSASGPSQPIGTAAPVGPERIEDAINTLPEQTRERIRQAQQSGTGTGTGGTGGSGDSSAPIPPEANAALLYTAALSFVSPAGNVARINVTFDENPYGIDAINRIPDLRETARTAAAQEGLAPGSVLIGGPTATNYDT